MSDLLSGINSATSSYVQKDSKTDALRDRLTNSGSIVSEDDMMSVCKDFEAYFTEQVFKAMEKMVPDDEDSSSSTSYLSMFKDTLTQEYAQMSAESNGGDGLGIAQMLYEQMRRNYGLD